MKLVRGKAFFLKRKMGGEWSCIDSGDADERSCIDSGDADGRIRLETVDTNVGLILTSFLTSSQTSRLRAVSSRCRRLFRRNCPVKEVCTDGKVVLFFEGTVALSSENIFICDPTNFFAFTKFFRRTMIRRTTEYGSVQRVANCCVAPSRFFREVAKRNTNSPLRCFEFRASDFVDTINPESRNRRSQLLFELIRDPEILLATMRRRNCTVLRYADESLKNDREFILAAVRRNGLALEHAAEHLKRDRQVVLAAVNKNGLAIEYAADELKRDHQVVLAAVKKNGLALQYAAEKLKKDRQVVSAAVRRNSRAIEYAATEGGQKSCLCCL